MKKKRIIALVTAAVMVAAVCMTGCSSDDSKEAGNKSSDQKDKKTVLTIEIPQEMKTGNMQAANEELYAAFEKKYPDIEVEEILVPDAQFKNVVLTKISAGEPSDILVINRLSGQSEYNSVENMLDLSDMEFVNRLKDKSIVEDPDGIVRCYQAKYADDGMCVLYNKTLFEELGIKVPNTWDEFLSVCETLKENGIQPLYGPYKDTWTFQILTTTAFGQLEASAIPGTAEKLNTGKMKWSEVPEFEEVLNRAMELVDRGYFGETYLSDDWASGPSKMTSGKYGMLFGVNKCLDDYTDTDYEYGMFPINIVDGIEPSIAQSQVGGCLFIPKNASNIEAAKKYIDFVSLPENADLAQKAITYIPSIEGAQAPVAEGYQKEFNETYIDTGNVVSEFNSYLVVDSSELWALYQEMLAKQITPKEVLESWDSTFSGLMKQAGHDGF